MTRVAFIAAAAVLMAGCAPPPPPGTVAPLPSDPKAVVVSPLKDAGYAGSARCQPCHVQQHQQWTASLHSRTLRKASIDDEDLLATIIPCSDMTMTHVMGERHELRFLVERPETPPGQGRWLALPCSWKPQLKAPETHHEDDWRDRPVESACMACHTTAFRQDFTFGEEAVGCEACHGPSAKHAAAPGKSWTLPFRGAARDEVTVCASCHLQEAVSRRTGRKFPDGFVPGGSLLDDFEFDWSTLDGSDVTKALDVHQKILVRKIVYDGDDSLRCTSCHSVHAMGHEKHRDVPKQDYCFLCHQPDMKLKEYSQSCNVCEF